MKTTNKLYAAGGGLLVAALIGFSPALADDNTTAALQDGSLSPIEMTMDETPATSTYTVDGVDQAKDAAAEETTPATDEATAQQKAKATQTPETAEKSSPEAPAPGVEVSPEPKTDADAVKAEETADSQATEEPAKDAQETKETEGTKDATAEGPKAPATEEKEAKAPAEAAGEVASTVTVPVTYVSAASFTASSRADLATPTPVADLGPLMTMANTEATPEQPNGESMVVWFELPEPAGPALVPGQATPMLGTAVSEEATVSSNVIPATAVQTAVVSQPQQNVTAAQASAVNAESGNLSRSLARTGSIAQYAAILSAAALILGVGLLVGAAATTRRGLRFEAE